MKRSTLGALLLSMLAACGGGGGGSGATNGGAVGTTPPPPVQTTPAPPAVTAINASQVFSTFLQTSQTVSLTANDGSLRTANLIVRNEDSYPFVTNGKSEAVAHTKVIQFQRLDAYGILVRQDLWKLHLDANMQPLGVAYAVNNNSFNECISVASRTALPTSTNASGIFFAGLATTAYAETTRNGAYAHFCDPSGANPTTVEWSVAAGTPNPYFCLSLPIGSSGMRARICTPADSMGNQSKSLWVRLLYSDGAIALDYKDTSSNRPVEQFSTTINPANYWYGAVWRPLDGYIYQRYPDTKFSSEQACREQSVIDWKKTWNATNIGWTCIHVTSN